ncbi:MAG: hypothetical protein J0M10_01705 [Chitinophagales bacterium]|nr:hypothetical protein [Chitinophagales bacterium]
MKKYVPLFAVLLLLLPFRSLLAQSPAGFTPGYVILADGSRLDGSIKESFKSKAAIAFQPASGKKINLGANAVNEVNIGGSSFVSYANDFFKVISTGTTLTLLQKVSDATGKVIYNGAEAAGISSGTEGRIGDFLIRINGQSAPLLVTEAGINGLFSNTLTACPAIQTSAKAGQLKLADLEKLVAQYNTCK